MNLTRMLCTATATAGIGVAAMFGLGMGTASADPGQPCGGWNAPGCQSGPGWHQDDNWHRDNGPDDWQHRGIDQGRQDHRPFNWNGQWVQPMQAGDGLGWGFWFLGQWIPF
jgi:hypothetical protein